MCVRVDKHVICISFQVPYFEELGCVTLRYLDTLFQRENIEKSNFFKGLPKVVAKLPKVEILIFILFFAFSL